MKDRSIELFLVMLNEAERALVTGVVLAGGRSQRMGRDKSRISVCGKPLGLRSRDALLRAFGTVIVVDRPEEAEEEEEASDKPDIPAGEVTWCVDDVDVAGHRGPLAGIASAMRRARTPWVFVLPCDSPLVSQSFLVRMTSIALREPETWDAVVPRRADGQYEPLHALYRTRLSEKAADCARRQARIIALFLDEGSAAVANVRVRVVGAEELSSWGPDAERSFTNANTRAELFSVAREIADSERALLPPPLRPSSAHRLSSLDCCPSSMCHPCCFAFGDGVLSCSDVVGADCSEALSLPFFSAAAPSFVLEGLRSRHVGRFISALSRSGVSALPAITWRGSLLDLEVEAVRLLFGAVSVFAPLLQSIDELDGQQGVAILKEMRQCAGDFDADLRRGLVVRLLRPVNACILKRVAKELTCHTAIHLEGDGSEDDSALLIQLEGFRNYQLW